MNNVNNVNNINNMNMMSTMNNGMNDININGMNELIPIPAASNQSSQQQQYETNFDNNRGNQLNGINRNKTSKRKTKSDYSYDYSRFSSSQSRSSVGGVIPDNISINTGGTIGYNNIQNTTFNYNNNNNNNGFVAPLPPSALMNSNQNQNENPFPNNTTTTNMRQFGPHSRFNTVLNTNCNSNSNSNINSNSNSNSNSIGRNNTRRSPGKRSNGDTGGRIRRTTRTRTRTRTKRTRKTRKRKRAVGGRRRKKSKSPSKSKSNIHNSAHILFASNVKMPNFDRLNNSFLNFQDKYRQNYKQIRSKKEINTVCKLTLNYYYSKIERKYGFKQLNPNKTILYNVAVFHSSKSMEKYTKCNEFVVLGNQTLCDLKDKIYCLMDRTLIGPFIKNSYFFIEKIFYDDMRDFSNEITAKNVQKSNSKLTSIDKTASKETGQKESQFTDKNGVKMEENNNVHSNENGKKDGKDGKDSSKNRKKKHRDPELSHRCRISEEIVEWSRKDERWRETGVYLQRNMENTKFNDINLRLGSHYLYCHQGDCEHCIIVTDMRLINPKKDCMNEYAYPVCIYKQILKRQKCGVCDMYPAVYVTYGDKYTTHNPFFFCKRCWHAFHYDKNGRLLYSDFKVFDYIHD